MTDAEQRDFIIDFVEKHMAEFEWENYRMLFPDPDMPPVISLGRIKGAPVSVSFTKGPEQDDEGVAFGLVKGAKCMILLPEALTEQIKLMVACQ